MKRPFSGEEETVVVAIRQFLGVNPAEDVARETSIPELAGDNWQLINELGYHLEEKFSITFMDNDNGREFEGIFDRPREPRGRLGQVVRVVLQALKRRQQNQREVIHGQHAA